MRPQSRDDFQIAIICALPLEFDAVEALFDEHYDGDTAAYGKQLGDANWYRTGRVAQHNIVLACLPGMGIGNAASVASGLQVSFPRVNLALLVGICGGVPFPSGQTEIILGDVVISDKIVAYGSGRQYPDGFQERGVIKETLGRSNRDLRTFLSALRTRKKHHQLQDELLIYLQYLQNYTDGPWQYPGIIQDQLFDPSYRHRHYHLHPDTTCLCMDCQSSIDPVCDKALENDCRKLGCMGGLVPRIRLHADNPNPQVHFGSIASADIVMKSGEHRDRLAETKNVIGFEMEGAGICDILPCVIIKGVCDYADSHKNKIWQDYASATAASCAKAFLVSWLATTQECSSSTAHLATIALQEFYVGAKRLNIQRISGELLPMDQCYINLAIVEHSLSASMHTNQQSSPFSLFNRLKTETVDIGAQVFLKTIFNPRKQSENKVIKPKRILIYGRAGVGKTTLCKKIVYEFLNHRIWKNLFDLLLWVPLRKLKWKSSPTTYNMENLFYDEYFSQHPDGQNLARAMWLLINKSPTRERTLFLLDGLDEVHGEWSLGTPLNEFLGYLLRWPQVIITSRPQMLNRNDLESLDLELETVGFLPKQVMAYIEKLHDRSIADQIQAFIHSRWLIQGLVRIPIQLDALCYSWSKDFHADGRPKTMTTLYEAITLKLWKKDILQLEKSYDGKLLTEATVSKLTMKETEWLVQDEINLLESLAFSGLYNNIIDFNAYQRGQIIERCLPSERIILSEIVLAKLSFLRTSDSTLKDEAKSYHFLHLTFQEFFAASYFVRQWTSKEPCLCSVVGGPKILPDKFLQMEKYNARYGIFWRFVAGLLQSHQEEKPLLKFFQMLDDKPRDLLGPTHQRLLMHCFSEVPLKPCLENLQTMMEAHLKQWALFEHKINREVKLCREMEFPNQVLHAIIKEEPEEIKKAILQSLQHQSQLSPDLLDRVVLFLGHDVSTNLREAAINALGTQTALPENILQVIAARLEDSNRDMRLLAADALGKQTALPVTILQAIVARLEDSNWYVRSSAIKALSNKTALPENILRAITALLEDSNWYVRSSAADALGTQTALPENILQAVVARLEDSNQDARSSAINALGKKTALPETILQAIAAQLEDSNWYVRSSAAGALGNQTALPDNILQAITARLEDSNWKVRSSAANALGKQPALPETIFQAIVARLEDSDQDVRLLAANTLGKQTALPDNILQAVVARLEDSNQDVRSSAINALGMQTTLPNNILQAIAAQLEDSNWYVRSSAAGALGMQPALPDNILQAIAAQLEDSDRDARSAAYALGMQTALPETLLQVIAAQLEHSDQDVRSFAINALGKKTALPETILQAIAAQLEDSNWYVRSSAITALGKQTALPETIIQAITARLEDSNWYVRSSAAGALGKQTALPENILQAIVFVLSKDTLDISSEAVGALLKHDKLYDNFPNFDVRTLRSLYKVLVQQSFSEQVSCYKWDKTLYIDMPDRRREISLVPIKNDFLDAFWDESLALGRPTADELKFT